MNVFTHFFAVLFNRSLHASSAQNLLERASRARGQSAQEASALRSNALALLRLVR